MKDLIESDNSPEEIVTSLTKESFGSFKMEKGQEVKAVETFRRENTKGEQFTIEKGTVGTVKSVSISRGTVAIEWEDGNRTDHVLTGPHDTFWSRVQPNK